MLKIVGTEGQRIVDEKILIDDHNKITKFGAALCIFDLMTDIAFFILLSKLCKKISTVIE